jgi:hypothetical protein
MNIPHKHAEVIKAWADGATIQCKQREGALKGQWIDLLRTPTWAVDCEYRVKPEVTTSLSDDTLRRVYYSKCPYPNVLGRESHAPWFHEALQAVANVALKQYIKEIGGVK